jgi:hypothetical protein
LQTAIEIETSQLKETDMTKQIPMNRLAAYAAILLGVLSLGSWNGSYIVAAHADSSMSDGNGNSDHGSDSDEDSDDSVATDCKNPTEDSVC